MAGVKGVDPQDKQFTSWGKFGRWQVKYDDPEKFIKYLLDNGADVLTEVGQVAEATECAIKIDGMKPVWRYKGKKYRHVGYVLIPGKGWFVTKGVEVQRALNKRFFG